MRKYAIFASLTILGMALVGRAVSLAQKPQKTPVLAISNDSASEKHAEQPAATELRNVPIVDEPVQGPPKAAGDLPTIQPDAPPMGGPQRVELLEQALQLPTPNPIAPPTVENDKLNAFAPTPVDPGLPPVVTIASVPAEPRTRVAPAGNDPMGEIESFLDRNRKEAEQSIDVLNQEAEALKSRLQKVEAALARWKEVSRALNGKTSTERAEPNADPGAGEKPPTQTTVLPTAPESFQPPPTSGTAPTSPDSLPVVPPPQPPTEPKPPEAIPTSLPAALPPTDPRPPVPDATPTSLPAPTETKPVLPEPAKLPDPLPQPALPDPLPQPALPDPLPQPAPPKPLDTSPDSFPALPETTKPPVPTSGPDLPNLPPPKEREVPAESSAA